MPRKDVSEHFANYTENNRIKHAILTKYLAAYLKALSKSADAIHYIDGFAGRGNYAGVSGSPILAIELLAKQSLPFSVSLVEADTNAADELRVAVAARQAIRYFDKPLVETGEFATLLSRILDRPIYKEHKNTATFAFVDPCRSSGYGAVDIRAILEKPYGECLIFWNYDGIGRWLGAAAAENYDRSGLVRIFGSELGVQKALEIRDSSNSVAEKENSLLTLFLRCTKNNSGAKFCIPFRFITEAANRTGHYLIHCCNNPLAFRIMKDVMASLSSTPEPGQFGFLGHSGIGSQLSMFAPIAEVQAIADIKAELATSIRPVHLFTVNWVHRPEDLFRARDYKAILLRMEAVGEIEVIDEDGVTLRPRGSRKKQNGSPTLADRFMVRLIADSK